MLFYLSTRGALGVQNRSSGGGGGYAKTRIETYVCSKKFSDERSLVFMMVEAILTETVIQVSVIFKPTSLVTLFQSFRRRACKVRARVRVWPFRCMQLLFIGIKVPFFG